MKNQEKKSETRLINEIIAKEEQCHLLFFGKTFDLTDFANILRKYGRRKIKFWQTLGLEPHFLPKVPMMPENNYPGWKIKPEEWFYTQVKKGRILQEINGKLTKIKTVELGGISVLVDTRLKPDCNNGKEWKNDNFCGPIIEKLRKTKKIANYDPPFSRFNVSIDEWEEKIKPAIANRLKVNPNSVLLESVIIANIIPQMYPYMERKNDGKTKTWCWFEDYFIEKANNLWDFRLIGIPHYRLNGIFSEDGGLADVFYFPTHFQRPDGSFRPLIVL